MCKARLLTGEERVASPKGNPRLWGEIQSPDFFLQVHTAELASCPNFLETKKTSPSLDVSRKARED